MISVRFRASMLQEFAERVLVCDACGPAVGLRDRFVECGANRGRRQSPPSRSLCNLLPRSMPCSPPASAERRRYDRSQPRGVASTVLTTASDRNFTE